MNSKGEEVLYSPRSAVVGTPGRSVAFSSPPIPERVALGSSVTGMDIHKNNVELSKLSLRSLSMTPRTLQANAHAALHGRMILKLSEGTAKAKDLMSADLAKEMTDTLRQQAEQRLKEQQRL